MCCAGVYAQNEEATTVLKEGSTAADFTAALYKGGEVKLSDYKGKVVLLNFWATWCGPCLKELKEMPELLAPFKDNADFVFLPVGREEKPESLKKFFDGKGKENHAYLADITAMDPDRAVYNLYATQYVPRSFVIGKDGKVLLAAIGSGDETIQKVMDTIKEALSK